MVNRPTKIKVLSAGDMTVARREDFWGRARERVQPPAALLQDLPLDADRQIHIDRNGLVIQCGRTEMRLKHRCNHAGIQFRVR